MRLFIYFFSCVGALCQIKFRYFDGILIVQLVKEKDIECLFVGFLEKKKRRRIDMVFGVNS